MKNVQWHDSIFLVLFLANVGTLLNSRSFIDNVSRALWVLVFWLCLIISMILFGVAAKQLVIMNEGDLTQQEKLRFTGGLLAKLGLPLIISLWLLSSSYDRAYEKTSFSSMGWPKRKK